MDDDALAVCAAEPERLEESTNRRLVRKIDSHLMPVRGYTVQ